MTDLDLRSYAARTGALVEATPPTTRAETTAWLVAPFLEALGWTVHDDCEADADLDGTTFDYVCSIGDVPALLVATEAFAEPLERTRAEDLLEAMAGTGIDRAIYANGEEFLFLADPTGDDRLACHRSDLPDHEETIARFARSALRRRLEGHSRDHVARRLALERGALAESMTDRLAAVAGDAHAEELSAAVDRFLQSLVDAFAEADAGPEATVNEHARAESAEERRSLSYADSDVVGGAGADAERDAPAEGDDGPRVDPAAGSETPSSRGGERSDEDDVSSGNERDAGTETRDGDRDGTDEGEYVVRFFRERGSIGAIGHSSPRGALVGATTFLLERGLAGVSLPWPDAEDGRIGPTVLNDSPRRGDGSPMTDPVQLPNGWYLEAAGDADACAARIEALAARAGTRPMLTGDWDWERDGE
ncbi:hypothetical protein ACFQGT_01020 [Natrialbaceae archaeon GCM10025810]|uniref:hypothetical protein n=1 Tax=Halovalidus salilacus TaxID=3075124 RepID=UPI00360FEEFA